jgi:hypothetical protein
LPEPLLFVPRVSTGRAVGGAACSACCFLRLLRALFDLIMLRGLRQRFRPGYPARLLRRRRQHHVRLRVPAASDARASCTRPVAAASPPVPNGLRPLSVLRRFVATISVARLGWGWAGNYFVFLLFAAATAAGRPAAPPCCGPPRAASGAPLRRSPSQLSAAPPTKRAGLAGCTHGRSRHRRINIDTRPRRLSKSAHSG